MSQKLFVILAMAAVWLVGMVPAGYAAPIDVLFGDASGDGEINTTDARLIQRCAVGDISCSVLTSCDANSDGVCNTTDARLIQRHAVGQINIMADSDEDGVPDLADNCKDVANERQLDLDHDGVGDACEEYGSAVIFAVVPSEVNVTNEAFLIAARNFGTNPSAIKVVVRDQNGRVVSPAPSVSIVNRHYLRVAFAASTNLPAGSGRARYEVELRVDGKKARAGSTFESRGVYLRASGGTPGSERIRVQVVHWGKRLHRPQTGLLFPKCEGQFNALGSYVGDMWEDVHPPYAVNYDIWPVTGRPPDAIWQWNMPDGREDWASASNAIFNNQLWNRAYVEWQTVCGAVWAPNAGGIVEGFVEVAPRTAFIQPWYSDLWVDAESPALWGLAQGGMWKPDTERRQAFTGIPECSASPPSPYCPWKSKKVYHPCVWVWPANTQGCEHFRGVRPDRILVSVHRTFQTNVGGVLAEVNPNDPNFGFRGYTNPISNFSSVGDIQNLILVAGSPCLGCTQEPRCDLETSVPALPNRFETDLSRPGTPNLLSHEFAHTTSLPDNGANAESYDILISDATQESRGLPPRGFRFRSYGPPGTASQNCREMLSRPFMQ